MFPDDPFKKINDIMQEAVKPIDAGLQDAETTVSKVKTAFTNFLTVQENNTNNE